MRKKPPPIHPPIKKPPHDPKTRRPYSEWKKPIKPTVKEYDARVDYIVKLISNQPNLSRYAIHQKAGKKFNVVWTTVERYLIRARDTLRERLKRDATEVRSNAVAFYEEVISNPKESTINRLRAQTALVELLGVSAPQKMEVTGAEGSPLLPTETKMFLGSLTVEQMKSLIKNLEAEERAALGDNKV